MAKSKTSAGVPLNSPSSDDRWQVEDALSTLRRAGEIVHDKKLMEKVRAMATERADEMKGIAKQANALAKMGRISPKQMAKLGAR